MLIIGFSCLGFMCQIKVFVVLKFGDVSGVGEIFFSVVVICFKGLFVIVCVEFDVGFFFIVIIVFFVQFGFVVFFNVVDEDD